jgi:anthranilate synthase/aminodeoxychorismate synthase-like glutamine amidotransferase
MLLVIDNYDSFTYNLVQYFGELGAEVLVSRNDQVTLDKIEELNPERIVISPDRARRTRWNQLRSHRAFGSRMPVLGVCLGHQSIGQVYGGQVVRAARLMHGKTSPILHSRENVFAGLPSPFEATRYHSLLVKRENLPSCLKITAWTEEGEIMGLAHEKHPVFGVQFHPESILTREGKNLLRNFLSL